jgi:ferredoxin
MRRHVPIGEPMTAEPTARPQSLSGFTPPGGETAPELRRPRDGRRAARQATTGGVPVPAKSLPQARPNGTPPAGLTGPIRQLLGPMTGSLRLGAIRDASVDQRLRVDWPNCKAHGLCAEIAPEIIHLDEWGYPIVDSGAVPSADLSTARKAVQVCPTLALRLVDIPPKS